MKWEAASHPRFRVFSPYSRSDGPAVPAWRILLRGLTAGPAPLLTHSVALAGARMLDTGSEYTADEIAAMLGHFASLAEPEPTRSGRKRASGIAATVPTVDRSRVPPDPLSSHAEGRDELPEHIRMQPSRTSSTPSSVACPSAAQAQYDDLEEIAQQAREQELLVRVAEAQSLFRKEIKRLAGDVRSAGDGGRPTPPGRFEVKWEKSLRQAKADANQLERVIQQLGRTGGPETAKLLKRYGSSRRKRIRFAVAKALRGVATPDAFYVLLALLRDRQDQVARAALISLAVDVNATTLPAILAYARLGSEEHAVVSREIRKLEPESVRDDLLAIARNSNSDTTAIAVSIAGQISDRNSVNDFSPFVKHADASVRLAALDALLLTGNRQVARFLTEALADPVPAVRARAAEGLARWPTKNSPRRVLRLLGDESPRVRRSAAAALKEIATHDLGSAVGEYLTKEGDPIALIAIIECVARIAVDEHSEALFALSQHSRDEVRIAAVSALSRHGDERVTASLVGFLEDGDPKVRIKAVTALGQPKNLRAIQQLAAVLKNDREVTVRAAAARALGQVGSEKAIPALHQSMYDDATVRCQAVVGLRCIGGEAVIPALVDRLRDSAPEVRYNAVSALGALDSKGSVTELAQLIEDSDGMVRRATHRALEKLGYGVAAHLRRRRVRRCVHRITGLIPNARVASTFAGGIVALVMVAVLIMAPQAIGLGPKLRIGNARHIDVSPDGAKVSVLRAGGINEVWNVSDGQLQARRVTPFSTLAGMFTPDSQRLRLFSDRRILTWNLSADTSMSEARTHGHMLQIRATSPDRQHLLTTSTTKITPEYWGPGGEPVPVAVPAPFLREVTMSSDGALVAGINKQNELLVLSRSGEVIGKQQLSFPHQHRPRVTSMAFSDKGLLAVGTRHGEHRIIDTSDGTEFSMTGGEAINCVVWIGNHLWSIEYGQVRVLHIAGPEEEPEGTVTIDLPLSEPDMIAISANSGVLAIGSRDSLDVVIVDTATKKVVQILEVPLG